MKNILLIEAKSVWDNNHSPSSEWHKDQEIVHDLIDKASASYNQAIEQGIIDNEKRMNINIDEKNFHPLSCKYISNYGFLIISGELIRRGHNCKYLNGDYFDSFDEFASACKKEAQNADIVCMTSTTPQYSDILKLALMLTPHNKIVLGGPHASCAGKYIIKEKVFDAVFRGYNVNITCDEIERIIDNSPVQNGTTKDTRVVACDGFTNLPKNFNLIPDGKINDTLLYLYSSVGCPNKCSYCCENVLFHKMTALDLDQVLEELLFLYNECKLRFIHFCDNDFLINKNRTSQILDLIEEHNIKASFSFMTSPNSLCRPGMAELLQRFVDLGLVEMMVGTEYFSNDVLNLNFKKYNISEFYKKFSKLREKVDIPIVSFLSMVGLPGETKQTIQENINWYKKFANEQMFDYAIPKYFVPYPNTDIYENPEKYGIEFASHDWSLYHRRSLPRPVQIKGMSDLQFVQEQHDILLQNKCCSQ